MVVSRPRVSLRFLSLSSHSHGYLTRSRSFSLHSLFAKLLVSLSLAHHPDHRHPGSLFLLIVLTFWIRMCVLGTSSLFLNFPFDGGRTLTVHLSLTDSDSREKEKKDAKVMCEKRESKVLLCHILSCHSRGFFSPLLVIIVFLSLLSQMLFPPLFSEVKKKREKG